MHIVQYIEDFTKNVENPFFVMSYQVCYYIQLKSIQIALKMLRYSANLEA